MFQDFLQESLKEPSLESDLGHKIRVTSLPPYSEATPNLGSRPTLSGLQAPLPALTQAAAALGRAGESWIEREDWEIWKTGKAGRAVLGVPYSVRPRYRRAARPFEIRAFLKAFLEPFLEPFMKHLEASRIVMASLILLIKQHPMARSSITTSCNTIQLQHPPFSFPQQAQTTVYDSPSSLIL